MMGVTPEEYEQFKKDFANSKTVEVAEFAPDSLDRNEVAIRLIELAVMGITVPLGSTVPPPAFFYAVASLTPVENCDGKLFVTRDDEFLSRAERLFERFGVLPVTPEEGRRMADEIDTRGR